MTERLKQFAILVKMIKKLRKILFILAYPPNYRACKFIEMNIYFWK